MNLPNPLTRPADPWRCTACGSHNLGELSSSWYSIQHGGYAVELKAGLCPNCGPANFMELGKEPIAAERSAE